MSIYNTLAAEWHYRFTTIPGSEAINYYFNEISNSNKAALELMCGTGQYLIPLLVKGINISGLDASFQMLGRCQELCDKQGVSTDLYLQLIQKFSIDKSFGLMFIADCSFCLIKEKQEIVDSLASIYNHLSKEGVLILEILVFNDTIKEQYKSPKYDVFEEEISSTEKMVLSRKMYFDFEFRILNVNLCYKHYKNGTHVSTENEFLTCKYYLKSELIDLLNQIGFKYIEAKKLYINESPSEKDNIVMFKCYK